MIRFAVILTTTLILMPRDAFSTDHQDPNEAISAHIEKNIGKIHLVLHEVYSPDIHVDIYWIKTKIEKKPVNVLVTSGMSDKSMNVPAGYSFPKRAELVMILPGNWQMSEKAFEKEDNYWPIRLVKTLARYPHELNTFLASGHTIQNSEEAKPYAPGTRFNSVILVNPSTFGPGFQDLNDAIGKIQFYEVFPLYPEELSYKLQKGADSLYEKFQKANVSHVLDIKRPNMVK